MSSKGALTLRIITPEGILFNKEDLNGINVPLADGCPIGIRPGHAPLIAQTEQGSIRYNSMHSKDEIHLYAGILDIRENIITVLTTGEVEKTPTPMAEPGLAEYDRLMQTLIKQIQNVEETEQETE
jgi:F0F1-type ATP synthase epsilon subunit